MSKNSRKLKCFVASAFDKQDVDRFYEKAIHPALKEFGILARAVNRVEHNENIDVKIIELINQSDFMIADLTYARPSVYYEAGFAEQFIPVIYTARKDHFRQRDNDPNGNLCVHFDLTKKNIIPWDSLSLQAARDKLEKRIAHVSRPLFLNLSKQVLEDERSNKFAKLSQKSKLVSLYKNISSILMVNKYHLDDLSERDSAFFVQYSKILNNNIIALNCNIMIDVPQKYFKSIKYVMDLGMQMPRRFDNDNYRHKFNKAKKIIFVWLTVSLDKISLKRIHNIFPTFEIAQNGDHLYSTTFKSSVSLSIPHQLHVCKVDGLSNESQFKNSAKKMIKSVENMCT